MAGPGNDMAAGAAGRGGLRASHADREQVIDTLKTAFVRGVLAKDEFDLRVGLTFASRTNAELAALTADLPAKLAAAQPPEPVRAQGERPVRPGRVITVATALCASMWAFTLLFPWLRNSEGDLKGAIILVPMLTLAYLYVLVVVVGSRLPIGVRSVPAGSHRGGQRPARAFRHPVARHQPTRVDSLRRSIAVTRTPPRGARSRPPCTPLPGSRSLRRGHSFLRRYAISYTGH